MLPGQLEILTTEAGGITTPVTVRRKEAGGSAWHTAYCHTDSFAASPEHTYATFASGSSAVMGDILAAAVAGGAQRIVVGTGPTSWHDAGAGMLLRLAELFQLPGHDLTLHREDGANDPAIAGLLGAVRSRLAAIEVVVAASEEVPLRGLHGAGAELAHHPNISAEEAQSLEVLTSPFVNAVEAEVQGFPERNLLGGDSTLLARRPYHGSGGGVAFLLAALGARVFPGAWVTGEETRLSRALEDADLVVTGADVIAGEELSGGVVADVAARAAKEIIPVIIVGRRVDASRRQLVKVGIHGSYPVSDTPSGRPQLTAPAVTESALISRGERLARTWSR